MPKKLPGFVRPPVVELVLGVQFDPLGLTSGHLGWFWKHAIGPEWTTVADAARLLDQAETFDAENVWGDFPKLISFRTDQAPPRLQISHASGERMIQVQDTRLIFNWVKRQGDYPRYPQIKQEFEGHLAAFTDFARAAQLNPVKYNQWEVTYVNQIPAGPLWATPADWPNVIPGLLPKVGQYGNTRFESMSGEWHSEIPEKRGRLHIQVSFQHKPAEEILGMNLTARGPVANEQGLAAGLDLGRETIVTAFDEIVSGNAKDFWGKESNGNS